jgi:hypothetical protein
MLRWMKRLMVRPVCSSAKAYRWTKPFRVRPIVEELEPRLVLSTNPVTFNFSIPSSVGSSGESLYLYMSAQLIPGGTSGGTGYTPAGGSQIAAGTNVDLVANAQNINGFDWADPGANTAVQPFQTVALPVASSPTTFSVVLPDNQGDPNDFVLSGQILMIVASSQPNVVTNASGAIPAPTPSTFPNNIYDFAEFTYDAPNGSSDVSGTPQLDDDLTQVDQVGIPFTITTTSSSPTTTYGITQNRLEVESLFNEFISNQGQQASEFSGLVTSGSAGNPYLRIQSPKDYLTNNASDQLNSYFNKQLGNFFNPNTGGVYHPTNSFNLEYPIGFTDSSSNTYGATDFKGNTTTLALPTAITNATVSSGTVSITAANNFIANDEVVITGVGNGYDGTFKIETATAAGFTYADSNAVGTGSTGTAQDMNYHPTTGTYYTVLQLEAYGIATGAGGAETVNTTPLENANGVPIYFNVYEPFFSTNTSGEKDLPPNTLPTAPSWFNGHTTETPGEMVFSNDGVFNTGPSTSPSTSPVDPTVPAQYGLMLADVENAIVSAFNRGIATSIAPNDWTNAPSGLTASPGNSGVSQNNNLVDGTTYYYVITANNQAGETVASAEVSATASGSTPSIQLSWTSANGPNQTPASFDTPAGVVSYNIYRGTSADLASLQLIAKDVANGTSPNFTPLSSFNDDGSYNTISPTQTPPVYYPSGGTSNYYAAFLHQNSTLNSATGITADGLSYAFPYDDQGGNSTNVQVDTPATATITLQPWFSAGVHINPNTANVVQGGILTIFGTGFAASAGNNTVTFTDAHGNPDGTGTVTSVNADGTQLTVQFTQTPNVGSLYAVVATTSNGNSGSPVQVATVAAAGPPSAPSNSSTPGSSPNALYVEHLFDLLFHHGPNSDAAVWVNQLNSGVARPIVVWEIVSSHEYHEEVVADLYQHYLPGSDANDFFAQMLVAALDAGAIPEMVTEQIWLAFLLGSPQAYASLS